MPGDTEKLASARHTLAHLLAAAIRELYPHAQATIGPAIDTGFYYDFDFSGGPVPSVDDLEKIQKKMIALLPAWKDFNRTEVSADEARKAFAGNQFKTELIDDLAKEGATITLYTSGGFTDLCRGGHVEHPSKDIEPGSFKLDKVAVTKDNRKELLYEILEKATAFLEEQLTKNETSKKYILGRGLTEWRLRSR